MADERIAHEQLDCLVESLVENPINPLSKQLEITDADLAPYHIRRVDFDIEAVPGPDSGILYNSLPQWKLDCHPIQATVDGESMEYRDYARAVQRNIPEDRLEPKIHDGYLEKDGLEKFSANPALLKKFDLAFGEETQFPVLMVSCLGPQHARLLYAHMDGSSLVIHQLKLYGFKRRDTAPWDLVARWVLSTLVS